MISLFKSRKKKVSNLIPDTEGKNLDQLLHEVRKEMTDEEVVDMIHREFEIAGDILLKQSEEALRKTEGKKIDKNLFKTYEKLGLNPDGMTDIKESILIEEKKEREYIKIRDLMKNYSRLKVISKDQVTEICNKYNLSISSLSKYRKEIPVKNLKDIKENLNYINDVRNKKEICNVSEFINGFTDRNWRSMSPAEALTICAPKDDLNVDTWDSLNGVLVDTKTYPDPVVLAGIGVSNSNGFNPFRSYDYFVIITAWGLEAADPLVMK